MTMDETTNPRHRFRRTVLLATLALAAGLLLAQCRSVTDSVFGRNSAAAQAESCFNDCAKAANAQMRAESDLHTANVKACSGDPTCLANEQARHDAAVAAIQANRKACQAGCHHQGSGSGR
jgi:hypothetical protein